MAGFFSNKETESKERPDGKVLSCVKCGLLEGSKHPRMAVAGNGKKGIMIIAETISQQDDNIGKPLQGKEGKLLETTLRGMDIDLWEDCFVTSAVLCCTKGEQPNTYQLEACRRSLLKNINIYKPKVVIPLGLNALFCCIGHIYKKPLEKFERWRGFAIPNHTDSYFICPVFNPSYVLERDFPEVKVIWQQDLQQAIQRAKTPFPKFIHSPEIIVLEDLTEFETITPDLFDLMSFDYETTGLKPYAVGNRIICASVCVRADMVYVFMMPQTREERQPFINLLTNPDIGKMAHNIKFEDTWTNVRLRTGVENWAWDSMQAAHILDNRPGICSLKFQSFVEMGVPDYADEVSQYLRGRDEKDSNSLNRIDELIQKPGGKDILLRYCALDSCYEFQLAQIQMKKIL